MPDAAAICTELAADLPEAVEGQARRRTAPESALTAAWGHPPIVLRCGVGRPAALEPTSVLESVDDVDWFREEGDGVTIYTTIGLATGVEVTVPEEYAPEVNALVDLAPAVTTHVPTEPPH